MAIAVKAFRCAMRMCKVEQLKTTNYIPRFRINGVIFSHSGAEFVELSGAKVPDRIFKQAKNECRLNYSGGRKQSSDFQDKKIMSIEGLIVLVALLEDNYSPEFVNPIIDAVYKETIDLSIKVPFPTLQMYNLIQVVNKFDSYVKPFGNPVFKMKNPSEYLNKVKVSMLSNENLTGMTLSSKYSRALSLSQYRAGSPVEEWSFSYSYFPNPNDSDPAVYIVEHNFFFNPQTMLVDEVISLNFYYSGDTLKRHPLDERLSISLKTGLAWVRSREEGVSLATDNQIVTLIEHLNIVNNKLKQDIVDNITVQ